MCLLPKSPRVLVLLAVLIAVASPLLADPVSDPVSDPDLATRRHQVFEDESLQIDLPGYEEFCRSERSIDREQTAVRPREPRRRGEVLPMAPYAVGAVTQMLQWALLALGAVALLIGLLWLLRTLLGSPGRSRRPQISHSKQAPEPEPTASEAPVVEDLDLLLHRGEYGAAIHLLLLRAVRLLNGRGGRRITAGKTSREVLAGADLQPSARSAFSELVAAVERFLFGGRELDANDFARCREAFGVVEESLREKPAEEMS